MNTSYAALGLYSEGNRFLHIKGRVTLDVAKLEPALKKRACDAVRRGFGTATQGPTHKLLNIVAKTAGYNADGFPYVGWNNVVLYCPRAAADDYKSVSDSIQTLMHLEGGNRGCGYVQHNEKTLMFRQTAPGMTGDQRKRLRRFIKDQAAKWMIFRQPMLDFLNDPSRSIVWDFDSDYREKQS